MYSAIMGLLATWSVLSALEVREAFLEALFGTHVGATSHQRALLRNSEHEIRNTLVTPHFRYSARGRATSASKSLRLTLSLGTSG